jgi:DNA polymerase-3 subunit beta
VKFTINKNDLDAAIQHVSKAVSARTTIPILTGIKIEADASAVTLTASDTTVMIQSRIPIELGGVEEVGSIVLSAKFFVEIIKKLPKNEVLISTDATQATIISGKSELQLAIMDAEEFPALPVIDESELFTIGATELKNMIRSSTFAVSSNENTPILTGTLWTMLDGVFRLLATDRHRMAWVAMETKLAMQFENIVIPGKDLEGLAKVLPDKGNVDIAIAGNQVMFRSGNVQFFTRMLDGKFPDTSQIIPTSYTTELTINTALLAGALDRAYLMSKEEKTNIVRISSTEIGFIEITSSAPGVGRVVEELAVTKLTGDNFTISFNSKYVLDALKVIDSEETFIGFNGALKPIILKPVDGANDLHLVLPYRSAVG